MRWALAIGRTPRELLAGVTSEDIAEMLAFAKLEPFGSPSDDFRAGQIAAIVANVNRDPKQSERFLPKDFFPWLAPASSSEPVLLNDPKKQADLIRQQIFGMAPGTRKAGKKKHG